MGKPSSPNRTDDARRTMETNGGLPETEQRDEEHHPSPTGHRRTNTTLCRIDRNEPNRPEMWILADPHS